MKTRIENVTLYNGIDAKAENTSILFDESGILYIGEDAMKEKADTVVDGTGLSCMPGLVNSHVHLSLDGEANIAEQVNRENEAEAVLSAYRNAMMQLSSGVVAVRDMGCKYNVNIALRNSINRGVVNGPRIYACGEPICMTGGHCNIFGKEVDGVDEARKAARTLIKAGANHLKVMATGGGLSAGMKVGATQLSEAEIAAICEEAKHAYMSTGAHAQGKEGIMNAIRAGITTIEHGIDIDDEVLEAMLEHGTFLCATVMSVYYSATYGIEAGIPEYVVKKAKACVEPQWDGLRKAHKAGVKILAGNDAGTPFNKHDDFASELIKMVELGMTVKEVIRSATYNPAECMKIQDQTGSIEVGKWPDLSVFEGDPEIDINAFRKVKMVYKDGICIYQK